MWQAGIDHDALEAHLRRAAGRPRAVYDKVDWDRDVLEPALITPSFEPERRGLTTEILHYGQCRHQA